MPSRGDTNLAFAGPFLIEKMKDHDIRAPILGMGREVASFRRIWILLIATSNLHDPERTVLLEPLLNLVNAA